MNINKKAQVSIEYLTLLGLTMLLLTPLMVIYFNNAGDTEETVISNQASQIAKVIRDSSETVYYLGEGAKKTAKVYMPKHVYNVTMGNNEVVINISFRGRQNEIVEYIPVNVTGSVGTWEGDHSIVFESNGSTVAVWDKALVE